MAPSADQPRITSLDFVRGVMLVASITVNSLLATEPWFAHAPWDGVQPMDVIFPVFVTLTGCGLAFAFHRRVKLGPLARRVAVLLLVGLVYNAIALDSWVGETWWFTGVLQLYAGVVAVIGLLHLVLRGWIAWGIATVVLAAGHATLLAVWARGCEGGVLSATCNPSGVIDPMLFGGIHLYHQGAAGYDPVGLVALLGALISASAGATAGHVLLAVRRRSSRPAALTRPPGGGVATATRGPRGGVTAAILPLGALALAFALLAQLSLWVPELVTGDVPLVMKRLWTPPFALRVAAVTTIALLVGHLIADRRRLGPVTRVAIWPLVALGRNSLLVYFGSHVVMSVLERPTASGVPIAEELAQNFAIAGDAQLGFTVAALAFWILLACLMRRAGVYLRP
ncbi:heparan-alpha-glucosaminide N-acetyltransferase domain-containing protein [Herbiconiux solani]|uniref:heparan-alpha-glucosaminide N-acetyltransferase domain-containing protein n=1 Tax=Herbiconiux solani TaxID=661329 RepID=UPI000826BBF1|nr:heparan-alpha-glucosaminide N-acetyltransferase domain-containing protein [Herbiconiux solani]